MGDFLGELLETATFGLYEHESAAEVAAGASERAAGTAASFQREALDYLKEREALPREVSEAALTGLAGVYGLPGGEGDQQALIDRAIESPLYQGIIGGREAGEEAILRSAAATGGLRSGDVQTALYDYNTQLENKALLESYNQQLQGLTGLAGLPSMAPQIAQQTGQIGQTLAQGQVAGAQALQTGEQNQMQNILGLGTIGAMMMYSDRRLKDNIVKIAEINGQNWYTWDWNKVANKMGLTGKSEGVLADEIYKTNSDAILFKDGFMMVNYTQLGIFPGEVA
jgi:hypothetical protein